MENTIRILVNEDDTDQVELYEFELKREGIAFTVRRVAARQEFFRALEEFKPDVILTDYSLSMLNGMEALRIAQERSPDIPVIIVTGSLDEETAADTIKAGAADYVIKQRLARLGVAVKSALEKKRIRKAKDEAEKALHDTYIQVKEKSAELQEANVSLEANIEKQQEYEKRLQDAAEYAESIIRSVRHPLVVLDEDLRVVSANEAFYQFFQVTGEETEGRYIYDLGNKQWNVDGLRDSLCKVIPENKAFTDYEVDHDYPAVGYKAILVSGRRINQGGGRRQLILLTMEDITRRKEVENTLKRRTYEFQTLVENSPDMIMRYDRQARYLYVNPIVETITGKPQANFVGKTDDEVGMAQSQASFWKTALLNVFETRVVETVEYEYPGVFGKRYFMARIVPDLVSREGHVDSVMVISRDITERKQAEEQIRYISFHDSVTGLYNRAYFEEELVRLDNERELPVSSIFGDVNNLKLTNDMLGHSEGDKLLKRIAAILRVSCRRNDIIARWGGDEFTVILPETDNSTAHEVCRRITEECGKVQEMVLQPSIALGIATKEQRDDNIHRILREAESRMYANKAAESGKNQQLVIESLLGELERRGHDPCAHIQRLQELAAKTGSAMGLKEKKMQDLGLLIRIHDIGQVIVPEEILKAPRPLSSEEWRTVKRCPEAGYRIARSFGDLTRVADSMLACRERWDGTGYPRGLKEKEIPYLARVFHILDAFDITTHLRPYARALRVAEAVEELRRNAGKQFDPELTDLFITKVLVKEEVSV